MTIVMIRQPIYLPYMGFFKKIQTSDVFVYLDDVQFSINSGDNRNKIKAIKGPGWLTVPLDKPHRKKINEVKIVNSQDWRTKHKKIIEENYKKAPYFNSFWNGIKDILNNKWEKLIDVQLAFIEHFNKILDLKTNTIKSSELNIKSSKSQRLLDICKKLNASTYVSGAGGKNYLDEKIFENSGIKVLYEKFRHPTYKQLYGNFFPNLSIIDLLFNEGENAKKILNESKNL